MYLFPHTQKLLENLLYSIGTYRGPTGTNREQITRRENGYYSRPVGWYLL